MFWSRKRTNTFNENNVKIFQNFMNLGMAGYSALCLKKKKKKVTKLILSLPIAHFCRQIIDVDNNFCGIIYLIFIKYGA